MPPEKEHQCNSETLPLYFSVRPAKWVIPLKGIEKAPIARFLSKNMTAIWKHAVLLI
jgi:hypothetical protein